MVAIHIRITHSNETRIFVILVFILYLKKFWPMEASSTNQLRWFAISKLAHGDGSISWDADNLRRGRGRPNLIWQESRKQRFGRMDRRNQKSIIHVPETIVLLLLCNAITITLFMLISKAFCQVSFLSTTTCLGLKGFVVVVCKFLTNNTDIPHFSML